jgi:hypothetical protein
MEFQRPRKATLEDRLAQGISQEQQSLLHAKGAKKHAPVGVILHLFSGFFYRVFSHADLIAQSAKKLRGLRKKIEIGPGRRVKSSPGTGERVAPVQAK